MVCVPVTILGEYLVLRAANARAAARSTPRAYRPLRLRRVSSEATRWRLGVCLLILIASSSVLSSCSRPEKPRHLLLITVDTLRADHLGCYGNALGLTPNLDRLAERSILFSRAYASAPYTMPSVTAILTGQNPEQVGVVRNGSRLPKNVPTMATHFRASGWKTGAVISNFVLSERFGLSVDFDEYDDTLPQIEANRDLPERIAQYTTDAALEMLDRIWEDENQRVFLWVHFQDPHGPYTPPGNRRMRFLDHERSAQGSQNILAVSSHTRGLGAIPTYQFFPGHFEAAYYRAGYDGEISYMDEEVGRLLAGWSTRGLMNETVVVFTSDHGEGLGENNYWFAHGEYLSEPLLHVPLLIGAPNLGSGTRGDIASLVDLLPTISVLFGLELADDYPGRDLLAEGAERDLGMAYSMAYTPASTSRRFGLAKAGFRYVVVPAKPGSKETFVELGDNSGNPATPPEDLIDELRTELESIRERFPSRLTSLTPQLSASDREKLRALGYTVGLPPHGGAFVSQTVPSVMTAGEQYAVSVAIRNTGTNTWTLTDKYRLGSQNPRDNNTWGISRVLLDASDSIATGEEKTFTWTVTAPAAAGTYNFQWQMVREGTTWFGDASANVVVTTDPP